MHKSWYALCTLLSRKTVLGLLFLPENLAISKIIYTFALPNITCLPKNTSRGARTYPRHYRVTYKSVKSNVWRQNFSGAGVYYALPRQKSLDYFFRSFFTSHTMTNASTPTIATSTGKEYILVFSHHPKSFPIG